jgi:hypothetical protein
MPACDSLLFLFPICHADPWLSRDFHGRVHRPLVKQLAKALEPHRPLFIEEPLLPGQQQELKSLYGMTNIPIAVCLLGRSTILTDTHQISCFDSSANVSLLGRMSAHTLSWGVLT